jgi:hypothetical protein
MRELFRRPLVICGPRITRLAVTLGVVLAAAAASGCTEEYVGGEACPALCPTAVAAFRDTTFDLVEFDTTIGNYPELLLGPSMLLANRPDTLVTRGVLRFDVLPTTYLPNRTGTAEAITAVDSVVLVIPMDTTGRRGAAPVTIYAYDVDTAQSDSVAAVVKSLFRTDRIIGATTVTPDSVRDTLRIPLVKSAIGAKIVAGGRLRVGLRLEGRGQLRAIAFANGFGASYVTFDPSTDTTYAPLTFAPTTSYDLATVETNLAYTTYTLTDVGSPPPGPNTLLIGGYPAYRSFLRFDLPLAIVDSTTLVRAEVLLTQRPSRFVNAADTIAILPLVSTASSTITDARRIIDLTAEGPLAGLDSTRLVPRDSGLRVINVLNIARTWRTLPNNVPRALAFRLTREGSEPGELRFFSRTAAPALRPRIRITYLPRSLGAIP